MIPLRNLRRFIRKAFEQPGYAVRVGRKRLLTYLYHWLSNGRAPLPEAITIFLTHKCNLRCKMCGQWGENGVTRATAGTIGAELTITELKHFIDDVSSFKPNITLFGGEPFFHRDVIQLIEHVKARGMHCLAITNGSLLKPHAETLVRLGLDELNLSLDGDSATHNDIRGMDGLFERIADGIEEVNRCKAIYKVRKPLINLQCTINRDNYTKLEEMLSVAVRLKANSLTYHHLIFLDEQTCAKNQEFLSEHLAGTSSDNWKGFVFPSNMDPALILQKLHEIHDMKKDIFVNSYPNFSDVETLDYYRNPRYLPKNYRPRCLSPWMSAYVFPDGEVRPCLNISYSYGNVKTRGFKELWNGTEAVRYRSLLRKQHLFPACIRCTELFRY
jgi:MoaA/NifB/PqqE/SkfB family radical SAM enzyme